MNPSRWAILSRPKLHSLPERRYDLSHSCEDYTFFQPRKGVIYQIPWVLLVYISENNRNLDTCISEHESGDQDSRVKCYCHACLEKGTCYLVELCKNSKAESNWQRYTIKRLGWLEVATTWTTGPSFHLLLVCSCSCHERPIIMELILNMKHTLEQTVNFLLQDLCMEGEGFPVQDFLRLSYTSCRRKLNIWSSSGVHHGNLTPWTVTS